MLFAFCQAGCIVWWQSEHKHTQKSGFHPKCGQSQTHTSQAHIESYRIHLQFAEYFSHKCVNVAFSRALYLMLNWLSYTLHFLFLIEALIFIRPIILLVLDIQKGFFIKPLHQGHLSPLYEVAQHLHGTCTYPP